MAWDVISTAVTGDIVPAAWGNRVRDNSAYLKGRAGTVAIEAGMNVSGNISAPTFTAGPSASAQIVWLDRGDNTTWLLYASGGWAWWYSAAVGGILGFQYSTGAMSWVGGANDRDTGIPPTRLRRVTRFGMRGGGGGTHTLAYLGDGRLDYIYFPDGIDATSTLTFHYDGLGRVQTIWLRDGGTAGGGISYVSFGYDGAGRVSSIAEG